MSSDARWDPREPDDTWRRPGPTATQRRWDVISAGLLALGAFASSAVVTSLAPIERSLLEQCFWGLAMTAPLALRRRVPITVLIVASAVTIGAQFREATGDNFFASVTLFLAIYTVGAWGRDRQVARWARIIVIIVMFGWLGIALFFTLGIDPSVVPQGDGPLDPMLATALHAIGINILFFGAAYYFGDTSWLSARRRRALEVQAEQLRASQAENARQAVVAERVRIARDLHDVVAHHVSVMGVQAAAARRVIESDPPTARRSLETIEDTARSAIDELHGLLGVLRSDADSPDTGEPDATGEPGEPGEAGGSGAQAADGARAGDRLPAPGLDQLPDLVAETRATGLEVRYATYGSARPVPPAVALSAYRVVQEALTNTVKHSGAGTVEVRVRFLATELEVEITDDGRGPIGARAGGRRTGAEGGGYGLVGMRERVAVHGGRLEVGPRRAGGYRVGASFPLPADTVAEPVGAGGTTEGDG